MMKKVLLLFISIILLSLPFIGISQYYLHIIIMILIWSFIYTSWSLVGRFRLTSLGHGAFMSMGAYGTGLLWNYAQLSPLIGIPLTLLFTAVIAIIISYACFSFRIVGHYFALATLALSEVTKLFIVATRDYTGGSLGLTPNPPNEVSELISFQFSDRETFYYIALFAWIFGLIIWKIIDHSMIKFALEAIAEDEEASASGGIDVTISKMKLLVLSAVMTAFGGSMYAQYQLYIAPEVVGGIFISLQIVFAVVAGGVFTMLGPTVGAILTLLLAESLRVIIGTTVVGLDTLIYGILLILFIIYMPKGIVGEIQDRITK